MSSAGTINAETPFGTPFRDHKDVDVSRNWSYFFREQLPQWSNIIIGLILGAFFAAIPAIIRFFRNRMKRSGVPPPQNPEW
jgi:hypothetical protein